MELDKLAVALRPRADWEAVDLGVRMVQAWARPLLIAWLPVYLMLTAALIFFVGYVAGFPSLAAVAVWWFKPLYDRVALHVLSRAVFGEWPRWSTGWRMLPSILFSGSLWRRLTWARLSPARSLLLPVDQLEGLRGKAARERRRLLVRQVGGAAFWLTWALVHFEIILLLGLLGLVMLVVPQGMAEPLDIYAWIFGRRDNEVLAQFVLAGIDVLIVAFFEPFYVASGFALYLKRRTDLEAWDVEVWFRRLRAASPAVNRATSILLAATTALVVSLAIFTPPSARAAEVETNAATAPARARAAIDEVLQQPEFGGERSTWRLQYVGPQREATPDGKWQEFLRSIYRALKWIGQALAEIGRVLMWSLLAVAIAAIVWLIWRQRMGLGRTKAIPAAPAEVAGFDIRPESLPDDIVGAAVALARAGKTRACLSLLYRASLSVLVHRDRVTFAPGDTEGDCLRRVRAAAPMRHTFFTGLTLAWQDTAYAHRPVAAKRLEELCQQWPEQFGA